MLQHPTFRAGDKVQIIDRLDGNDTGCTPLCYEPKGYVGRVGYITETRVYGGGYVVHSRPPDENDENSEYYGIFKPGVEIVAYDQPSSTTRTTVAMPSTDKVTNNKENKNMTTQYYRVLKDVPYFAAGAILEQGNGSSYVATDDYWNTEAADKCLKDGSTPYLTKFEVEYSPEFFERVYEISKLGKMMYVTKEAARAEAAKLFKNK